MKGIVLVLTGDGKGKSSSAFGMVIRSLGWGRKVLMIQFRKGLWETGEGNFFANLKDDKLQIIRAKCPFTWQTTDSARDELVCKETWKEGLNILKKQHIDMIVLDELMIVLNQGFIDLVDVLDFLKNKPESLDVVMTGRSAPKELIDVADTVTELKPLKHAFEKGILAKKGVDF